MEFQLIGPKRRPIFGIVRSGVIDAVGRDVTSFQPGDQVFGMSPWKSGCYAEYVCWSERTLLAVRPANLSHAEAVALPYGGLLASHLMRKADIKPGQCVLVYGASGAIGTATAQLAKHYGAIVTGICSTTNLELVKSLGADAVNDPAVPVHGYGFERCDNCFQILARVPAGHRQSMYAKGSPARARRVGAALQPTRRRSPLRKGLHHYSVGVARLNAAGYARQHSPRPRRAACKTIGACRFCAETSLPTSRSFSMPRSAFRARRPCGCRLDGAVASNRCAIRPANRRSSLTERSITISN
jgi:hypothetical protein